MDEWMKSLLGIVGIILSVTGFVVGMRIGKQRNWHMPIFLGVTFSVAILMIFIALASGDMRSFIGLICAVLLAVAFLSGRSIGRKRNWLIPNILGFLFASVGLAILILLLWIGVRHSAILR